jgi:aspartyl-tRNA(Asn)/glutamyl-tRNA(Gln) amidotransferase subunit C
MAEPKITSKETRHVADLARLALSDSELETMRGQLDSILGYMADLENLDITGIEPTFYSIAMEAPLRADINAESLAHDEALRAAPEAKAGAFAVPKIME